MDGSKMKKHIGVLTNTGSKVMVVFRKIPGDEKHCLVVETDRCPDMYHDGLQEIVNSKEAQQTMEFSDVLNRRVFADGLNALQALHYKGLLKKVPVSLVTLYPLPGQALPLELLNAQVDGNIEAYQAKEANKENERKEKEKRENPLANKSDPDSVASGLMLQAELLEAEAQKKREEAYLLNPSLKNGTVEKTTKRGRPELSETDKAIRLEERKIKRKERDRAKAAQAKLDAKEVSLKKAVDAKILRDAERSSTT